MKRACKIGIGIVAALSLGLAAAVVNAHPFDGDGPGWGGYGPGAGMGRGMGPGAGMGPGVGMGPMGFGAMAHAGFGYGRGAQRNPSAMAEARMAYMKAELKITPTQESAWKAFADQAKQQSEAMQSLWANAQSNPVATAPERLEQRNQLMKKRQEQMEKSTAAFKTLYGELSHEQKLIADQQVGMFGGRGMRFGRAF